MTVSKTLAVALVATLAWLVQAPAASAAPGGNSGATITGEFADSCTDFSAHSSKDISHVEIHYADGGSVKDETTTSPDFSIAADEEIDSVIVKSGTTSETFTCTISNSPPKAVLEIETPPVAPGETEDLDYCMFVPASETTPTYLGCFVESPRTAWTHFGTSPDEYIFWGFCADHPDRYTCETSLEFTFRGTSSSDPDGDLVSWSIDFGDATSASGDWTTDLPTALAHTYSAPFPEPFTITLTVTDTAGQSDSETMTMFLVSLNPV